MSPDARPDGSSVLRRLERAAVRARHPEDVLRLVLAAARVAWPEARADLLARRPRRPWRSGGHRPPGPPLAPTLRGPRSDRGPVAIEDAAPPGASTLEELGLPRRLVVTARPEGLRVALSAARARGSWSPEEAELLRELLAIATPALLGLARRERLEEALRGTRSLGRFTTRLNRSLDLEEILCVAADGVRRSVQVDAARLHVVGPQGERFRLALPLAGRRAPASVGLGSRSARRAIRWESESAEDARLDRALETGRVFRQTDIPRRQDATPAERRLAAEGIAARVVLPLSAGRRVIGALELLSRDASSLRGEALSTLRHVARPLGLAVENARLFREAAERARQMEALHSVALALGSADDVDDVIARVLTILHETFAFEHSAVLTLEASADGSRELVLQAARGYSVRRDGSFRIPVGGSGVTARAARSGELVHVRDVREEPEYVRGVARGRSEVALPLLVGGEVVGVLDVESQSVDAFTPSQLETLRLFSTQVALALQRARIFEDIRRQARTDSLTGLLNQRAFREKVAREIDRSRRTSRHFVLALIDLDDFKQVNDTLGHEAGNRVISRVGRVLRERVRSIDAAARFGGDEFALVLSETEAPDAVSVLEDVRQVLLEPDGEDPPVSLSIGVAEWVPRMERVADVVVEADRALYAAKAQGKGRVVAAAADATSGPAAARGEEARPGEVSS